MPQIAPHALTIPASPIRRIFDLAQGLDDVVFLNVGEPDLPVAPHVLAAGAQAWRDDVTDYTPNGGIPALRRAIAGKLARDNGLDVDPEQVWVTAGGMQALHQVLSLTLDAGQEVLVPDPGYVNFSMTARHVGAVPVPYPLDAANGFRPDLPALEAAVTGRTRVLLVNSPSNPLGTVYPADVLAGLLEFARRHDLWVVSDEVYERFTYGVAHVSPAGLDPDGRVLSVFSFSKTYALTGARVGWFVAPPAWAPLLRTAQESVISCVNAPAQHAALAALEGDQQVVADAREHYRANIDAACEVLDGKGVRYQRPAGAFYLWVDVSHVSGGDVSAWCERFLVEQRVAVAPGSGFGASGEGCIRLSLAGTRADVVTGVSRIPAVG
ncbi:pyridoxal phosphate-dependent aminotransferase [Kineococcus rhizosphaerae]|uniref:Aminotransferase n=1 Tax=Kineococcus rhizosphaerae TaxID=559628 RepID=A0A2T0QXM7_9ACTN|nr:aminotransferase class I/II-fold pyridoxal phosphate-dependent enzyme [Kineococcus rhizosphaerae]PRY10787.1 aspartate aminotransferase [Kineococcus rhizosphaerae]